MVDDDDTVAAALQMGARGYVLKGAAQEDVLAAIRTVASGGAVFGAGVANGSCTPTGGVAATLTDREAQVLALIADGRSNAEIARELGLEPQDRAEPRGPRAGQAAGARPDAGGAADARPA